MQVKIDLKEGERYEKEIKEKMSGVFEEEMIINIRKFVLKEILKENIFERKVLLKFDKE